MRKAVENAIRVGTPSARLSFKKSIPLIGVICIVFLAGVIFSGYQNNLQITPTPTAVQAPPTSDYISYQGETGKNALTLLKSKTTIEQDKSGLVISINARLADVSKREYWAFYVNSKLAPVGPADYQTEDDNFIEWKIEKY